MSDQRLPDRLDPLRFAEARRHLGGEMPVSGLVRLAAYLSSPEGVAQVDLQFGVDEAGVRYVAGRITATLWVTCQRCLEPMEVTLETETSLGIIQEEAQAEALPEEYEPLLSSEQPLFLKDIVEDELILALPIVAKHLPGACPATGLLAAQREGAGDQSEKENPFAVLERLKKRD